MPRQPNILFLFSDQQRFDTIGALGNPVIRTPALDRLVREGTAFTSAYTPSPVCVSARACLTTGLPCHLTGVFDNDGKEIQATSMMEALSKEGYQTHGVSKMHFIPNARRLWGFESRDFHEEGAGHDDYYEHLEQNGYGYARDALGARSEYYYVPQVSQVPDEMHTTSWTADRAIDFLQRRDTSRPFFLWASFIKPHPPFETPFPWYRLYRTAEMSAPEHLEGAEDTLTYWNRVQNRYKYKDAGYDGFLARTTKASYYACISHLDYHISRILEALGDEADNTLIVFSADHGEYMGDFGCYGKRGMHDASCRVPMLLRWPGQVPAGQRCDEPVSLLDLFPTFLQAAGSATPKPYAYGHSLLEVQRGQCPRDRVIGQFQQGRYGLYMSAGRRWKYVYSAPDESEYLFDRERKDSDAHNLAGNPCYQEVLEEQRQLLQATLSEDGYEFPLQGNAWRQFPRVEFPTHPDAGVLFQDCAGTQEAIDALGPYARKATLPEALQTDLLTNLETDEEGT